MPVKKYNPTSPGQRFRVSVDYSVLTKGAKPEKKLIGVIKSSGGRNSTGRMTVRNRGGGHKRRYRVIDFKRDRQDVNAKVLTIEYDPNRTCFISLIQFEDGEKRYILAPEGIKEGDSVMSGSKAQPELGNALYLSDVPLGSTIHNIELHPGQGGVIARSAGTYAQLVNKDGKYAIIKLPSGETRMILLSCMATIGTVSNSEHSLQNLSKAGRSRWLGRRPRVRGVAMNPVDHPMGGGEGKSSGGHPRSRTGVMAKGQKTRNPNKASNKLIITRRKSRK